MASFLLATTNNLVYYSQVLYRAAQVPLAIFQTLSLFGGIACIHLMNCFWVATVFGPSMDLTEIIFGVTGQGIDCK